MGKNQNTFEKRRREFDKKQKAQEKRVRKEDKKKNGPAEPNNSGYGDEASQPEPTPPTDDKSDTSATKK